MLLESTRRERERERETELNGEKERKTVSEGKRGRMKLFFYLEVSNKFCSDLTNLICLKLLHGRRGKIL